MPRPAHVLAVSGALVAAGVLVVGGTAYATTAAQVTDEAYVACVELATGAMRLIDPLAGHACTTAVGPGQERQISWSRTAGERGPQGPAGPRGPSGEDGEDAGNGQLRRLEELAGLRCTSGDVAGRVEVRVDLPERGSGIRLVCMTGDTVTAPPTPTKPSRPTEPVEPTRPPATADQPEPAPEPTTAWPGDEPSRDPAPALEDPAPI